MTPQETFLKKYGHPVNDKVKFEKNFMEVLIYPSDIAIAIPCLGKSLYCNKDFAPIYVKFLRELIKRGLHGEIHSNDECYMVREVRGVAGLWSIHSWAMACDLNPQDNLLGLTREEALSKGLKPFTDAFIQTGRDVGLVMGYDFSRHDGMHLENTKGLYN